MYFCTVLNAADIYALIEKRRSELGLSQAQLGQLAFGQGNSAAIQNLRRGSVPAADRLSALAEALGLELYFGPKRDAAATPPVLDIDGEDFATVKRVAAEASAGPGRVNGDAEVIGSLAFRRDWLRERGVKPERALLVTVKGTSMDPHIKDGDLVLVDLDRTEVVNGEPYIVIDGDGQTLLKRLHRLGRHGLVLVSDNPAYPPDLRNAPDAERVKVLGRVVWSGHNWE